MRQLNLSLECSNQLRPTFLYLLWTVLSSNSDSVHDDYTWKTLTSTIRSINYMPNFNPVRNRG